MNGQVRDIGLQAEQLADLVREAECIVIGAGSGLSSSAGLSYSGARFDKYFADFRDAFGIRDMYSGGFYPFPTLEEYWAWWSRQIYVNRYLPGRLETYGRLLSLVDGRDYFVLTTNVDHCFQKNGFAKDRLFYMQGDYGLWQCSMPCHEKTYDNEAAVRAMLEHCMHEMRIPADLVPRCPVCGRPMTMNLRADDGFVQDEGWYEAAARYRAFREHCESAPVLYLELGVGFNTPGIIRHPFRAAVLKNPRARIATINRGEADVPQAIAGRSLCIDADIAAVLEACP